MSNLGDKSWLLHEAITSKDVKRVKRLVSKMDSSEINKLDENRLTALCWACGRNELQICEMLIKNRADPNLSNPLLIASAGGNVEVCDLCKCFYYFFGIGV